MSKENVFVNLYFAKKNIDLIHELINITDFLLDRPIGTSLKLINYVPDRPGHDFRYAVDSSKLHRELGWRISKKFNEKVLYWYENTFFSFVVNISFSSFIYF